MTRRLVVCLLLFVSLTAAYAAAPPPQWLPSESWPGGKQYDARLDKTARLWVTGTPLAEVFQRVEEQTGVHIGFFPPDDMNRRVCVNLYLNPEHPPTLRELMAQLSWVLDCAFSRDAEEGEPRYALLRTSLGEGDVIAELEQEEQARQNAEAADATIPWQVIPRRREEFRRALTLSREEAIRQYQGTDDVLLLAMLDPARRAMAQLFVSLSLPPREGGKADILPPQKLSALPEEVRRLYLEALRPELLASLARAAREGSAPPVEGDPVAWLVSLDPEVHLALAPTVGIPRDSILGGAAYAPGSGPLSFISPRDLRVTGELDALERVEVHRLMGEELSDEDVTRLLNADSGSRADEEEQRRQAEERARREQLPAQTGQLLSRLHLPLSLRERYTLWQVQEITAKLSGLDVVSDCFWQPRRDLRLLYNAPSADREAQPTALMALKALTTRGEGRTVLLRANTVYPELTGWEWKGTDRFLAFRSMDRGLWRSAFLPAEAVRTLDGWMAPYLSSTEPQAAITVTPDWRAVGRLITGLAAAHLRWGGLFTYAPPTDLPNAYRQSFRRWVLHYAGSGRGEGQPHLLRFLGSLSGDEWQQLNEEGLRIGASISLPAVTDPFRQRLHEEPAYWRVGDAMMPISRDAGGSGFREGDLLRLRGGQLEWGEGEPPDPTLELQVTRDHRVQGVLSLRTHLTLRPESTESIAVPPASAARATSSSAPPEYAQ